MSVWIESHQRLRHEPKVYALAERLGVGVPHAIGILHLLWWLVIDIAEDGDTRGIPLALLRRELHSDDPKATMDALRETGFIDADGKVHNWMSYAGRLINDRNRKRVIRKAIAERELAAAAKAAEDEKARLDALPRPPEPKHNDTPLAPKPKAKLRTQYAVEFERFWELYPNRKAKPAAERAFIKAREEGTEAATIFNAILDHAKSDQWVRDGGKYIPHPATFLNQKRWLDGPTSAPKAAAAAGDVWSKKS